MITDKQTEVLAQITDLMREHFDAAVFIFETDAMDDKDPTLANLSYRVSGTFSSAIGLCRYAERKMIKEE